MTVQSALVAIGCWAAFILLIAWGRWRAIKPQINARHQERQAQVYIFPARGRRVQGVPQKATAPLDTAGRVTRKRTPDDDAV